MSLKIGAASINGLSSPKLLAISLNLSATSPDGK